jgi:putative nucleotidyltransferase with HDIG domain
MLCVEAAMRAYAKKFGEDEEMWAIAGLLHDFDYEKYPAYNETDKTGHPFEGVRELEKLGYPKEIIEAILGHALYSGVPRASKMAKILFACDELCGFIIACALMKPDKLASLDAKSVKKKLNNKNFAAKVSREDIALGLTETGMPEDEHFQFVINALRGISLELGF